MSATKHQETLPARPVLFVLAGVNGAGKSSVGGQLLVQVGMNWFNPDTFARELMATSHCSQLEANAVAWQEGLRRLDHAIADGQNFAFETTLGGNTVPARIQSAAQTHDVLMWFCGLATPEQHIRRVKARVAKGGHDIPEDKIRARFDNARSNLISLMPYLTHLRVYDNSRNVAIGAKVPDPVLILEMVAGEIHSPISGEALRATPDWAKPLLEAALRTR